MDKVIYVEAREVLLSRDYIAHLSASVSAMPISRREVLNWGSETLYDWLDFGGRVLTPEGEELDIYPGVFDDAHGEDGSGSWISCLRLRSKPRRASRATLLGRLRLYDSAFKASGRAVLPEPRQVEFERFRSLLRSFTPVWRARYIHEVRKLRRAHRGKHVVQYGAAVRRLRIRFEAEWRAWHQANA